MNYITAVRNLDGGLAEARNDGPDICSGDQGVGRDGITDDGLNEGGDGARVAVVEANWDRKDLVGGCGRKGYSESSAYGVGVTQVVAEETEYLNNGDGEGRPWTTKNTHVILFSGDVLVVKLND